jgi:hypothetical protein
MHGIINRLLIKFRMFAMCGPTNGPIGGPLSTGLLEVPVIHTCVSVYIYIYIHVVYVYIYKVFLWTCLF